MPRSAKLGRHKGYWYTRAGRRSGVFFGKVNEVSHQEALRRFRKYLATLGESRRQIPLSKVSVAEVCDAHLQWVISKRSDALYRQRRSVLENFCNHVVGEYQDEKIPGYGKSIASLRATCLMRSHLEQYLEHRSTTPSNQTGRPLGDKSLRAIVISCKACWNWAAESREDGGGGFLAEDHRPLAKLPRGYVAPKDLSEIELPSDEEIESLLLWSAVEPSMVRSGTGSWRTRLPDEYYTPDSKTFADMLKVYHATGPRTSELCVAQVRDFMPRTSQLCLGKHKRSRTQNNPSLRTIQVGEQIIEVLMRNAKGKSPSDPLFTHEDGKAWDMGQITKRIKKIIALACDHGQEVRSHITIYSFRDLYISELLMIGTEPFKVAKMAGTSLREIERTYGHFFNEDLAIAQAQLEKVRKKRRKKDQKQKQRQNDC